MADSPFVGPSYPLPSKPASVQDLYNMYPVPIEPGNERAGWVFQDVPGLVDSNATPGVTPYVNCDLLLHYDDASPSGWKDYSQYRRTIAIFATPANGSISSDNGKISRAARFVQTYPASGSGNPNASVYLTASGDINFGTSEFFIGAWVNLDGTKPDGNTSNYSMSVLNCMKGEYPGYTPWFFNLTSAPSTSTVYPQVSIYADPLTSQSSSGGSNSIGSGWTHVACSRSRQSGGNDYLCTFVNGVIQHQTSLLSTFNVEASRLGYTRIGTMDTSTDASLSFLIQNFHGLMDELYVNHGTGTGISTNFTPPVVPFDSVHTLRQILGLDP